MSITLTHTRPAPVPHQTPELEPAGLADLSRAPVTTEALDILDVLEAEAIGDEDFWGLPCDILVPAALEGQVDDKRAERVKARLVVEGANGPVTKAGDKVFADRGITLVPDVIANSGGVIVSYFEWVQDFSSFFWGEDEINLRLEAIQLSAFRDIQRIAAEKKVSLRTAAYIIACQRVLQARAERGLYP